MVSFCDPIAHARRMFSPRTNWPQTPNALATALAQRQAQGQPVVDLTESNPTQAGFDYPGEAILESLANPASLRYEPSPRGLRSARDAIAGYYAESGIRMDADSIVLATGTSEAYSHALRLLTCPGDEILCPSPSYPLFDFLADINDVRLVHYPLAYEHGWRIDLEGLHSAINKRSRAIVIVNPNNPTGSYLSREESTALVEMARAHDLALIVDEVFRDYAWPRPASMTPHTAVSTAEIDPCLTFTLNGLSKLSALPQMKLAWLVVSGPEDVTADALWRLEVIADTFLSVSTPVQHAAARLVELGKNLRRQILARIAENLNFLDSALNGGAPLSRLDAQGGWYAVLRLPNIRSDENWAIGLLQAEGVYVHPGHFFGFPREGHLVISLLPKPQPFRLGVEKILSHVAQEL
jgi:aspartate/methionine/tyrosine aminotransferase